MREEATRRCRVQPCPRSSGNACEVSCLVPSASTLPHRNRIATDPHLLKEMFELYWPEGRTPEWDKFQRSSCLIMLCRHDVSGARGVGVSGEKDRAESSEDCDN